LPLKAAAHHAVFGGGNRDTETYCILYLLYNIIISLIN
jgi:hypothetical protein